MRCLRSCVILLFLVCTSDLMAAFSRPDYQPLLTDNEKGQFGRLAKRKYGLKLVGMGGGPSFGPKGVGHISLTFSAERPLDLANARRLCVACVEDLLFSIQQSRARKNLSPVTVDSIKLSIDLQNLSGRLQRKTHEHDVTYISLKNGIIVYNDNEEGEEYSILHHEKYESALKIVSEEMSRDDVLCW